MRSQQSRFWEAADIREFECDEIVDCDGGILAPGFIDVQINGAFGVDFSDPGTTREDVQKLAVGLLAHGVTAFCPTIVTSSPATYRAVLPTLHPWDSHSAAEGASNLGVHLEGPFINLSKKGAHAAEFVRSPVRGFRSVEEVYGDLSTTRIVTLAPELPGALDAIQGLADRGIVVSMGHSAAGVEQGDAGFVRGATLITHLFNVRRRGVECDEDGVGGGWMEMLRERRGWKVEGGRNDGGDEKGWMGRGRTEERFSRAAFETAASTSHSP